MRSSAIALLLFAALVIPASADAHSLTKSAARAGTIKFMDKFAWAFDEAQTGEKVHVRPAQFCERVSHVTVNCPIKLTLPSSGAVLRGDVRVHRTSQGLLGYLLPWDPAKIRETLGKATSSEGVADTIEVGVQ